ncbi:MAG: alcohol dehydrogenase [Anaerolineaceae bacterium]|nr:alcohol dehydrogenase [Anaerolineaceae bacterium]
MKAVVFDKKLPEHLANREVEKPVPNADEVLVKVVTVSINAADYRSMRMGSIPKRKIFGSDIAGRVEAVGKNIQKFKVGDEVFGDLSSYGFGGFAEYVTAPENLLALKPAGVSFTEAAAVPMAALTALQGLRNLGKIKPGQKVLIHGAGGGVGTFAVQLAKYFGTEVTAVCGPHNVDLIRSLGADYVIDYSKEDFSIGGPLYDLVLVVNGNNSLSTYRRVMAPKGKLVMLGGGLSQIFNIMLFGWLHSLGGKKMRLLAAKASGEDLEFIIQLVEEGKIKPIINKTFPLDKTAEAVQYISQGHARGKIVINVPHV